MSRVFASQQLAERLAQQIVWTEVEGIWVARVEFDVKKKKIEVVGFTPDSFYSQHFYCEVLEEGKVLKFKLHPKKRMGVKNGYDIR